MKSQTNNGSQNGTRGSTSFLPLLRLALLVVPELIVFKTLSRSPVVSGAAAVVVLAVWLTIDVWPFRVEAPKLARARVTGQIQPVQRQKMNQAGRLNYLFCRIIVFALMFHSKLTI